MLDAAALAQALRGAVRLRDKLVVVALDPADASDPARIEALAADLSLLRTLGIKVITACDPGSGPGPLDAQAPAMRLSAALDRHGERGVSLPAAGLVTVHRIPHEALAAAPGMPPLIPVVNSTLLIHLSALGYLPVLVPPVVDAEGRAAEVGAATVAAFVAQMMSATLLVLPEGAPSPAPAQGLPPIVVSGPSSPGTLIAAILLRAVALPAEQVMVAPQMTL